MFKLFIKGMNSILPHAIMMVLCGDLLYLYYFGGWYDPNRFLEISELVVLYFLGGLSVVLAIKKLVRFSNTLNGGEKLVN